MTPRSKTARLALLPLALILIGLWLWRWPTLMLRPHQPVSLRVAPATSGGMGARPEGPGRDTVMLILPARDPFQIPAAVATRTYTSSRQAGDPTIPFLLQGIIRGVTPPKAIVNDQLLAVGDSLEGAKIVAIEADGVTVDYQGRRTVLRLPKPASSTS